MALELHPEKNNGISADMVTPRSGKKLTWLCPEQHEWVASPHDRTHSEHPKSCPKCKSLGFHREDLVFEWDDAKNHPTTVWDVTPGSDFTASWVCKDCDHPWAATVKNRALNGSGCPRCAAEQKGHWTLERIRHFIKGLIPQIKQGTLDDADKYLLFEAAQRPTERKTQDFINAFTSGNVSLTALEEFVGKPGESKIDEVIDGDRDLGDVCDDPYTNDGPTPKPDPGVFGDKEDEPREDLPNLRPRSILGNIEKNVQLAPDDAYAQLLADKALNKLWGEAFEDEVVTLHQAGAYDPTGEYDKRVKQAFLAEYAKVAALQIPEGYNYRQQGVLVRPNLMQRLVAHRAVREKYVANWSGAGAGKTLAFVLASRLIGPGLYFIVCPNDVVGVWQDTIKGAWSNSEVTIKSWDPPQTGEYRYMVLNYAMIQKMDAISEFNRLANEYPINMMGLDEMHKVKKRGGTDVSTRRKVVEKMVGQHDFKVMGMTATPVINDLVEPKSLLDLLSEEKVDLDTDINSRNAVYMHYGLLKSGVRYMPRYNPQFKYREVQVDCSAWREDIKNTHKRSLLEIDRVLTEPHLEIILPELVSKTIVYSYYIDGIQDILAQNIRAHTPFSVGFHDSSHKDDISDFIHGDLDVLIASSSIEHGIDGLQNVCSKMAINSLPWTNAQFEQLIGRIYRQGQRSNQVEVVVPIGVIPTDEGEWSWDRQRINHIKYKESLADCVIKGTTPGDGEFKNRKEALANCLAWLRHVDRKVEEASAAE